MKRVWKIIVGFVIVILGALFLYAPYFVVEVKNPLIELVRKKRISKQIELRPVQERVQIEHDGLKLQGILTKSNTDTTKATIILVHGIRGNKGWWHTKSLVLSDSSYQTLAIDLRAHGESEGKFTTFGVKEKQDIKAWIDWLEKEDRVEAQKLGIWGQSLGGAVALQTLAVEDRLQFGVIESAFSDFAKVAGDYGQDYIGIKIDPLTNNILKRAGKLADFDLQDANPAKASESIKQPILFIHGEKDNKIDISYNRENFNAIPHQNKEFYVVKDAGHYDVWNIGDKTYRDKVFAFIDDVE